MSKLPGFFRRWLRRYRWRTHRIWLIDVDPHALRSPTLCVCCGRVAVSGHREVGGSSGYCVQVPHCELCARHVSRAKMRRLGALGGSVLLAISSASLLALSWFPHWFVVGGSVGLSLLPWLWLWHFGLPRQLGHAARGQALWWRGRSLAVCSRPWAEAWAELNGNAPRESRGSPPRFGKAWVCGPLLALLVAPALHPLFCPTLRVMNFTEQRLTFTVDSHVLGTVDPTSGESPAAGVEFRVPSGVRRLRVATSNGRVQADETVTLRVGHRHLFAPGAREECFYIQQLAFGRSRLPEGAQSAVEQQRPLVSAQRFWVIGPEVDPWFIAEKSLESGATTGGLVSLLRMGRCR